MATSADPRTIISKQTGYSEDTTKQALNETLNGSKLWKRMDKWLRDEFPVLYKLWMTTNIKETGTNISKMYK